MGKIIVIDGLDGCGKATQAEILYNRLKGMGKNVHKASFPNYNSESSSAIKMYLRGDLGSDASKLNPFMCSLFYTVDRAIQFNKELFSVYSQPDSILICDRYLSANIIHQGSKFDTEEERKKYFEWVYDTEVTKVGLPLEAITIVLRLPVSVSQKLMLKRYDNDENKKDIHESDLVYLDKCYNTVDTAVEHLNSRGYNWVKIDCDNGNNDIRTLADIASSVWQVVESVVNE